RVEVQPQARVEAEQTTKSPIAWLVYGRPVQMTNQTTAGQQALQVSGETRETGSTPAILMSRTTESDVVIPGLAVSSLDETGMQHGQSEPGTAHQFGATVQPNLMAVQGHAGETPAGDSEKAAVSDQVARQVVTHLKPSGREQGGDQSVTFRLSPEHLGDIQLSMHMDAKQGVKIEIVAENRGVRETLLQQADDLRETLARQNIKMDSFDVSTGLGGGASQQTRDWRQQVALQQQSQRVTGVERNLFRETAEIPIRYIEAQYQSTLDVRF
ncbi:flagellar hook-length control protein FliK, partial [Trichlorobacter lovleyi]|uniref:flagellar hook-length control protein FliK n=2 Tax=Trichlorobacter lovleyi TaxID=313985 RepID=UPI00248096E8